MQQPGQGQAEAQNSVCVTRFLPGYSLAGGWIESSWVCKPHVPVQLWAPQWQKLLLTQVVRALWLPTYVVLVFLLV